MNISATSTIPPRDSGGSIPAAMLETRGLTKAYGALVVTDNVSLSLQPGARHALLGPNGAGKSTLVGLLSGTITADSGRIELLGEDVTRASPGHRVRKGLVRTFQISSLFPCLSVLENVLLAVSQHHGNSYAMLRPISTRHDLRERAIEVIEALGLTEDMNRLAGGLAYGRQRLLEMAISLSLTPKVLLLDEPAAGVPSGEAGVILEAMDRLPKDIAILMIEHDMEVVRRFASEVTILAAGKVVMRGSVQEVMESDEVRSLYLGRTGHARLTNTTRVRTA
jgi:branched-chain amino acid transport system ATP-binding protein